MKSKKLNSEHKKTITEVLNQVMSEYEANNKIIFSSESERARHHFGLISKRLKDWRKSKQCMVPGCPAQNVNKSHAIPRRMSLTQIGEDGHLLTPRFDQQIGAMVIEPVGISLASTFPGFCSEHERLFEEFERQKKIETEAHIYLQTYRAACRELFRSKFLIQQHEWLMSSYCRLRDERLMDLVRQRAVDNGFPGDVVFRSFSYSNDPLVDWANQQVSAVRKLFSHVQDRILPALQEAVFHGNEEGIFISALSIDLQIPVALSGCAAFFVNDHGIRKQVHLMMNVLPCSNHSILIFSGDIDNRNYIQLYIHKWTANTFSIVSMIESWMVNGTDQWYLKPSIWNSLADSRKAAILNAMFECEQNIGEEYRLSIFDSIRTTLLTTLKAKEERTQDGAYWRFVESQKAKMV